MNEYPELKSACEGFLLYCEHISRREQTERHMRRMYELLKQKYEPQSQLPALGVSVSEGIGTKDRAG